MEQYFEKQPTVASEEKKITWHLNKIPFQFYTDRGVFSRNAVDFGSLTLIEAIKKDCSNIDTYLDLGCGYGPIGIILSNFISIKHASFSDHNLRAVELTKKNLVLNNISYQKVINSDGFSSIFDIFQVISLNPPIRAGKEVVFNLYDGCYKHLKQNGILYIVVQKKQGANSHFDELFKLFGNCEILFKDKGYHVLKSIKKI
ncbi:MAG: class I SAM-dependent methyltransferase [Clostridiales bacterium]|nr:class I SAM-dependent methyltransferase [Clostridiales bacterium]